MVLLIGFAGALGTLFRYFLGIYLTSLFPTFLINLIGAFLIGVIWGSAPSLTTQKIIIIGFLGGFTTFSSLCFETFSLLKQGQFLWAITYPLISVIFGVSLTALGFHISR